MKPITFTCEETLPLAPEDIARQILDLTKWPDFHGYGPMLGRKRLPLLPDRHTMHLMVKVVVTICEAAAGNNK